MSFNLLQGFMCKSAATSNKEMLALCFQGDCIIIQLHYNMSCVYIGYCKTQTYLCFNMR